MSASRTPRRTGVAVVVDTIVGRKTADFVNRHRMAMLLATLVLLVLATPIGDVVSEARLVLAGATLAFMLAALQQADAYPRLRLPSRLMVLVWMILNLLLLRWEGPWLKGTAAVALAAVVLSVLWLVAQRLVKADRVDAELLYSALGAYLLLGIFWAGTYEIISLAAPAVFAGPDGTAPDRSALLYFSFTTLTTTGYGDITAVNPIVRMWSIFEAIIGTMYNATVIARLVSLFGSRVRRENP
jgi:hypothetical protein